MLRNTLASVSRPLAAQLVLSLLFIILCDTHPGVQRTATTLSAGFPKVIDRVRSVSVDSTSPSHPFCQPSTKYGGVYTVRSYLPIHWHRRSYRSSQIGHPHSRRRYWC